VGPGGRVVIRRTSPMGPATGTGERSGREDDRPGSR
jgi:hypothetical protein